MKEVHWANANPHLQSKTQHRFRPASEGATISVLASDHLLYFNRDVQICERARGDRQADRQTNRQIDL